MDPNRFDDVTRRLARMLSRRSLVEGSAGVSLAGLFGVAQETLARRKRARNRRQRRGTDRDRILRAGARDIRAEACTPNGKPCGKAKKGKKLKSCSLCCSGFNITTRSKKKKCACRPDGQRCTEDAHCCAGICGQRVCGALS